MVQSEFTHPVLAVSSGKLSERVRPVVEAPAVLRLKSGVALIDETVASMEDGLVIQRVRYADARLQESPRRIKQGLARDIPEC